MRSTQDGTTHFFAIVAVALSITTWVCNGPVAVLANNPPQGNGVFNTTTLDTISSTRGSVPYRGASAWAALTPGTSGHVLTSNGAGADPSYQAAAAGGVTLDGAYDFGGAGAGRTITADTGAVRVNKTSADANNALEILASAGTGAGIAFADGSAGNAPDIQGATDSELWLQGGASASGGKGILFYGGSGVGAGVTGGPVYVSGGLAGDAPTAGGAINFQVAKAGTGTTRTTAWSVANTGFLAPGADNTYDIGATATTLRPRNVYAATSVGTPLVRAGTSTALAVGGGLGASAGVAGGDLQFQVAMINSGTSATTPWAIEATNGHLKPGGNGTYDLGSSTNKVRNIYGSVADYWVQVTKSAAQSLTNATDTTITWNTETSDGSAIFAANTLTVPTGGAGLWHFEVFVGFTANGTGIRELDVFVDGASARTLIVVPSAAAGCYSVLSCDLDLADAAAVTIHGYQSSGGPLDVLATTTIWTMRRVGKKAA